MTFLKTRDETPHYIDNVIKHTTTVPYSPQENGIAERVKRTMLNAASSALHHSGLPKDYWEDAIKDAAVKHNHTLHLRTG